MSAKIEGPMKRKPCTLSSMTTDKKRPSWWPKKPCPVNAGWDMADEAIWATIRGHGELWARMLRQERIRGKKIPRNRLDKRRK